MEHRGRMAQARMGAVRRPTAIALVSSAMLLIGLGQASANAATAVSGGAYGYSCTVSAFGTPCTPAGPTPAVSLASNASNSPQSAGAASARADSGPATIFSSGAITVGTQGTLGPPGSVTSTAKITNVNASGNENFTASNLAGSCSATESGATGSTAITGGTLQTDNGDSDPTNSIPDHAPVTVTLPTSPAPDTTYSGHLHIGNMTDSFRWVFNEQSVSPSGVATVNAAHEYLLGPIATGNLIVGQSVCGVAGGVDKTTPETTIVSGPSGTIGTTFARFVFSASEIGSKFACRLDGPGTRIGGYTSCASPKSYDLANGGYTFFVRATDPRGNTDPTPATRAFTVMDHTPPSAKLSGRRVQKLGKSVRVRVLCRNEACRAIAGGSVRVPRPGARAKRYRLKKAKASIAKGHKVTLRPKLSRRARKAIKRALLQRRRVVVRLKVTVTDKVSNKRTLGRRVRLKL